jgi:hypothetical protein
MRWSAGDGTQIISFCGPGSSRHDRNPEICLDYVACGHLVQGGRCVRVAAGEPPDVAAGGARAAVPTADRLCDALHLIVHATSLGGVESTIERRRKLAGQEHVPPGAAAPQRRCEHIDDLWNDLKSALQHAPRPQNFA